MPCSAETNLQPVAPPSILPILLNLNRKLLIHGENLLFKAFYLFTWYQPNPAEKYSCTASVYFRTSTQYPFLFAWSLRAGPQPNIQLDPPATPTHTASTKTAQILVRVPFEFSSSCVRCFGVLLRTPGMKTVPGLCVPTTNTAIISLTRLLQQIRCTTLLCRLQQ